MGGGDFHGVEKLEAVCCSSVRFLVTRDRSSEKENISRRNKKKMEGTNGPDSLNSAISNQLEAGSIMVRAMKSICKLSLPLRVHGPMRSTHKHSQGIVQTVFGGRWPYFRDHLLLIWQDLQEFVSDRMVVRIPFQYIAVFIVSSRRVCPRCCR